MQRLSPNLTHRFCALLDLWFKFGSWRHRTELCKTPLTAISFCDAGWNVCSSLTESIFLLKIQHWKPALLLEKWGLKNEDQWRGGLETKINNAVEIYIKREKDNGKTCSIQLKGQMTHVSFAAQSFLPICLTILMARPKKTMSRLLFN